MDSFGCPLNVVCYDDRERGFGKIYRNAIYEQIFDDSVRFRREKSKFLYTVPVFHLLRRPQVLTSIVEWMLKLYSN